VSAAPAPGRTPRALRIARTLAVLAPVLCGLALLPAGRAARAATLDVIPDCGAARVARDASGVVAVTFRDPEGYAVVRWTPDRVMRRYPVDGTFTGVHGVAQGGTVAFGGFVVGTDPEVGPYNQLSLWTEKSGVQVLPHLVPTSRARHVAVGGQMGFPSVATVPVRWIDGIPSSPYLPLPGPFFHAAIVETNWNGSIAWGWLSQNGIFGPLDYYRWTPQTGGQWIPHPAGFGNTDLLAVVPEADVFIGRGTDPTGRYRSFFLTPAGTMTFTPQPPTDEFLPFHATADLRTLLGRIGVRSYLWTATGGFREVNQWATQELGIDLDGWDLTWTAGMSADGRVVTLDANKLFPDPVGRVYGCAIIRVPEPQKAVGLASGALGLVLLRRGGRHRRQARPRRPSRSPDASPARSTCRHACVC
jgi:hypothetical protein